MKTPRLAGQQFALCMVLLAVALLPAASAQERPRIEIVPGIGHAGAVNSAAFSPDGAYVLSGGEDGTVKLWDAATARLVRTFLGHIGPVTAVAFAPDRTRVLSGDNQGTLKLWDAVTGEHVRTFEGHSGGITSAAFSPDGKRVLSGSADRTVRLWVAATGRLIWAFQDAEASGEVTAVAFSPDGARVASGGHSDSKVKLWDSESGRLVQRLGSADSSRSRTKLAFSPDGTRVLVGAGASLQLWDVATGRLIRALGEHTGVITLVAISPDGARAFSEDGSGLRSWDMETGQRTHAVAVDGGIPGLSSATAISADGTRVLSAGQVVALKLWDMTAGREIHAFRGHSGHITAVAVSPDGDRILSAGSGTHAISIWEGATGRLAGNTSLKDDAGRSASILEPVTFSADGAQAVSVNGKTLTLWNAATGQRIRAFDGHTDDVRSVAVSPDGTRLVSGGDDKTVKLWDVAAGQVLRTFEGHSYRVRAVGISRDGARIVSGGTDGTVKVWEVATGLLVRTFELNASTGWWRTLQRWIGVPSADWTIHSNITAVAFSPDGTHVLSAYRKSLNLGNVETGAVVRTFDGHLGRVKSLTFSPDGTRIVSGGGGGSQFFESGDTSLRLWDAATGRLLHTFEGHSAEIESVAFSPDGRRIFSSGRDGTIRVWDPETHQLLVTMLATWRGEWLVVTPEGFFAASSQAPEAQVTDLLSIVRGLDVLSIRQVHQALYRPDLVRAKLAGDPDGNVRKAAAERNLAKALDSSRAPQIGISSPKAQDSPRKSSGAEVAVQLAHSGSIDAVALSADGRLALSGSDDKTAKLWDVTTGRVMRDLIGHTDKVTAVAFSPDSRFALSGSHDETLKLWDVATGKLVRSMGGASRGALDKGSGRVTSVAFSPDGRFALSGRTFAETLTLWDLATGAEVRAFQGHARSVTSVAFSPDGRFVVSGSEDATVKLWDASTGAELRTFRGHTGVVTSVTFSPDGSHVLSGGGAHVFSNSRDDNSNVVKLWDVATGADLRTFRGHKQYVTSAAFSPDGRFALSGSWDGTLQLWEVAANTKPLVFKRLPAHAGLRGHPSAAVFSRDGRFVLSGGSNGMALWDAATCRELRMFTGYGFDISSVAYSLDGRSVLVRRGHVNRLTDALQQWNTVTGKIVNSFSGYDRRVLSLDGRLVLSADFFSGVLTLLDAPTGKEVLRFNAEKRRISSLAFSRDSRFALSGSKDGVVGLLDVAAGEELRVFRGHTGEVTSVAFIPDGRSALSSSNDGTLKLWDVATGAEVRTFHGRNQRVDSVTVSPDGRFFLSGDLGSFKLWEVATGKSLHTFGKAAAFSPDGRFVVSASIHGLQTLPLSVIYGLTLWDAATGKVLRHFGEHKEEIVSVAFSPNSRFVVSGSADTTLKLWELATGGELRSFTGHANHVTSVAFSPDGRFVLSGSRDGTIRLWGAESGREIALMLAHQNEWLALTPEGFFSSSHRDTSMLAIVRGMEVTTVGQIHQSLFSPDLVREALAGDADGEVRRAAGLVNLEKVLDSGPPPSVAILSPAPESSSGTDLVTVAARITDRGKGIGRIEWRVNGVTTGVKNAPVGAGPEYDVQQTLALDAGENKIEVIAYERRNLLASLPVRITITYSGRRADATKPNLHVLAIGINAYVDKGGGRPDSLDYFPPLNLAVADAKALAADLRKAGAGLYNEIHVTEALDTDAAAANLDRIVAQISARISPRDTFVLFAAAHGTSKDGRFYLIPQDYQGGSNPKALAERAIDQDRLQDWVANRIRARRAIILLDTCESGALVGGHAKSRTDVAMSEAAIGRLHEATGRPVLTAAASGKPAFEGYQGHGVFTFAVMDALRRGDSSGNGTIEVSELVAHVQSRVPELSAELNGRGVSMVAMRGATDDKQSAHFGSTGEDFGLVQRLP